jgi:hypothetical protein
LVAALVPNQFFSSFPIGEPISPGIETSGDPMTIAGLAREAPSVDGPRVSSARRRPPSSSLLTVLFAACEEAPRPSPPRVSLLSSDRGSFVCLASNRFLRKPSGKLTSSLRSCPRLNEKAFDVSFSQHGKLRLEPVQSGELQRLRSKSGAITLGLGRRERDEWMIEAAGRFRG